VYESIEECDERDAERCRGEMHRARLSSPLFARVGFDCAARTHESLKFHIGL
jgi:hypothetical protein